MSSRNAGLEAGQSLCLLAPQPPESPRFADMKLIDYDQVKYGSVAERKRLIARWDKEVNTGGK